MVELAALWDRSVWRMAVRCKVWSCCLGTLSLITRNCEPGLPLCALLGWMGKICICSRWVTIAMKPILWGADVECRPFRMVASELKPTLSSSLREPEFELIAFCFIAFCVSFCAQSALYRWNLFERKAHQDVANWSLSTSGPLCAT